MTILTVLYAYWKNCLPGLEATDVDEVLVNAMRRLLRRGHRKHSEDQLDKRLYEEHIERLLLSLANQQLVTSLAIVIAAFSKWNEISLFSHAMAFTMATVSLVTPMATLRFCPK
jgi:hypothetical protein